MSWGEHVGRCDPPSPLQKVEAEVRSLKEFFVAEIAKVKMLGVARAKFRKS
jgi:hypothetical protein